MGDDHTAESSTVAHQTEFNFVDTMIPILNPAGVQELMDYGLYAYALSRFAGTWAAVKCVKDNIESTASVDGSIDRVKIILPTDFVMPPGGLNIRHEIDFLGQEARLHEFKRAAAVAFVKANRLNQIVMSGGPNARIGIVSVGKSYLDVRQALDELGIDEVAANRLGIRVFKVACPWPMIPRRSSNSPGARDDHRRRGEALSHGGADPRGTLWPAAPAAAHRQAGRARRMAFPGQGRA